MANTRKGPASSPAAPASASKKRGATDSAETTPAKRGRGRPAKKVKESASDELEAESEATPVEAEADGETAPAKRGRGRPKKDASSPAKPAPKKGGSTPVKPAAKKAGRPKKQTTIEDSMDVDETEDKEEDGDQVDEDQNGAKDDEKAIDEVMKDVDAVEDDSEVADQIKKDTEKTEKSNGTKDEIEKPEESNPEESNGDKDDSKKPEETNSRGSNDVKESNGVKEGEKNAFDEVKADAGEVKKDVEEEQASKTEAITENNESIVEDAERKAAIPSSILEKGVIYFFYRPRVNIEVPQGIEDVARTFIVLRPIPIGAKLGDGPLEDSQKARLLALPKKMVPKSKDDKFLMFTDKVGMSIKDIRDEFSGSEYATKTAGLSNSPAAAPFAEGVYVITSTDGASHLAYFLTKPSPLGELQKELGLHDKGSFVLSAKNPEAGGSSAVNIDNPAEYPESIQKQFRGRSWLPLIPEMLDYVGTQFLIIGEGFGELNNAVKEMGKDKKDDEKEKPEEELEKLEEEDHDRVENLKEDDPVFADLGLSSKEYSKIETTW